MLKACLLPFTDFSCPLQLIPQVRQTVTQLYEFRAHLQQKWETGRTRLEQIYQFRLFEDDASRMTAWLEQQSVLLLTEHAEIGETASQVSCFLRFSLMKEFIEPFNSPNFSIAWLDSQRVYIQPSKAFGVCFHFCELRSRFILCLHPNKVVTLASTLDSDICIHHLKGAFLIPHVTVLNFVLL